MCVKLLPWVSLPRNHLLPMIDAKKQVEYLINLKSTSEECNVCICQHSMFFSFLMYSLPNSTTSSETSLYISIYVLLHFPYLKPISKASAYYILYYYFPLKCRTILYGYHKIKAQGLKLILQSRLSPSSAVGLSYIRGIQCIQCSVV
jgi:hypothetical protein